MVSRRKSAEIWSLLWERVELKDGKSSVQGSGGWGPFPPAPAREGTVMRLLGHALVQKMHQP